ncbi:tetratricopeptide repeat protein, partial [Flavobacteriales bacterium]|nr:tetratricopeptide repeat protein [Flavobacteriales bacterium]
ISFLFIVPSNNFAQGSNIEMAKYYYSNGDFEKAKLYYDKIYKNKPSSAIFTEYLNTLVELNEFKTAEKITKNQIKKEKFGAYYKVKLGVLYEKQGLKNKADEYYNSIIDKFSKKNNSGEFKILANEFVKLLKYDLAIKTLEKCDNTHVKSNNNISIASIYGQKGDHEKMIDSYLIQIDKNPKDIKRIKIYLPRSINFEEDEKQVDYLRKSLLKKVQKNPENESYYDLLIWVFQQQGDFESAFIQVKAFDKRTKSKGEKTYKFAQLCMSNKKYDMAVKAFDHVINNQNKISFFAISSKQLILTALQNKIFSNANYTDEDLRELKARYLNTLNEITGLDGKAPVLEGLAYLEAFYIHNIDTAEILYNQLLNYPGMSQKQVALNKIQLGDIYMLKNEIWDASLLYMQVEKKFKHDIIGSQAKFKNAKLYYYSGDFEWSQNQLEGLKASTSKLIANDAIELSLLITDNYNMDTTVVNMVQFAQADLLIFQNKLNEASLKLDSINDRDPNHSLSDEILYKRYEIAYKKQEFEKAKRFLEIIMVSYPEDILADNAIFKLAELEENQLNQSKAAFLLYEKLLFDYPGSLFVVEARKRYRKYAETLSPTEKFSRGIK